MSAKFVVYKDRKSEWRWRLKAKNGRIVADSGEGYTTRWRAVKAAYRVQVIAMMAPKVSAA